MNHPVGWAKPEDLVEDGHSHTFTVHSEQPGNGKFVPLYGQEEVERLRRFETAYKEWHDKTEWVQDTAKGKEWGMHRADILKQRIENLEAENARLKAGV